VEHVQATISVFVALLAAALIVGIIAERIHVPYSVALLLASVPLELKGLQQAFVSSLLFVFLPALIFEAAWNVDSRLLFANWRSILLLAGPGVILTTIFVGFGLVLVKEMTLMPALLLGAILAATDPVAVIPILRKLNVPHELATIVEGESLLNDGIAIAIYTVLVGTLVSGAPLRLGLFAEKTFVVSLGGIAVGLVASAAVALLLRLNSDGLLVLVGTVVAVFGAYLSAEHWHFSGIFATVAAGIALQSWMRFPKGTERADVGRFWSVIAFFSNSLVFLLMGIRIDIQRVFHEPDLVLWTALFVTVARLFLAYGGFGFTKPDAPFGWRHVVALSGMRGALSIALALNLPQTIPNRPQIIDAAFGVVLITLVFQGLALGPTIPRLDLSLKRTAESP
jgi:CPA1 family monovalent cation:H+ antiporter